VTPLRLPHRSVRPEDFPSRQGVCQNLDCLAPLEPPYRRARLVLPGATLETVLCSQCLPQPRDGTFPELCWEVVAAEPVLALPGPTAGRPGPGFHLTPVSQLPQRPLPPLPPPPPEDPARRPPTFAELVGWEPRLHELLAEARSHHHDPNPDFCANAVWYGYPGYRPGLKSRLGRLVGVWAAGEARLRTPQAYHVACHTLYAALPDCRGRCACSLGQRGT
jgi:hypothetical protein